MTTRFYHAGLVARDAAKLAAFYIAVLGCTETGDRHDIAGLPVSRGMGLPGAHLVGLDLRMPGHGADGPVLEIFQLDRVVAGEHEVNRAGLMHLAFSVDDVAETLALLIAEGGSTLGEITSLEVENVGTATMVYARDPEGNIVEIQKWKLIES